MFRTLIYPSSGACDCVDELPHRSPCSQFVVCWWFCCGWLQVVFVLQAEDNLKGMEWLFALIFNFMTFVVEEVVLAVVVKKKEKKIMVLILMVLMITTTTAAAAAVAATTR